MENGCAEWELDMYRDTDTREYSIFAFRSSAGHCSEERANLLSVKVCGTSIELITSVYCTRQLLRGESKFGLTVVLSLSMKMNQV